MKTHIGILGPHTTTDKQDRLGREVGRLIAKANAVLFCGGLGGMMRAVAEGAKSAGGQTVGILPGTDKSVANEFIDIGSGLNINGNLGVGWDGGSRSGSLTIGGGQTLGVTSVLYVGNSVPGVVTIEGGGTATVTKGGATATPITVMSRLKPTGLLYHLITQATLRLRAKVS